MAFKHLVKYFPFLVYMLFSLITESASLPLTDFDTFISTPDDIDFPNYRDHPVASKGSLLNRLTRGYYYIANGEITPINPTYFNQNVPAGRRRLDSADFYSSNEGDDNSEEYTSLAHYNKPHAKRKMLFVPNFFG